MENWQRVLWKKQKYKDNYVPEYFFRVHTRCEKISFYQALYGSMMVSQEIFSCLSLIAIFVGLSNNEISGVNAFITTATISSVGYSYKRSSQFFHLKNERSQFFEKILVDAKATIFTLILGYFVSPIVKTLTESFATDSIQENMCNPNQTTPDNYVKAYTAGIAGNSVWGPHTGSGIGIYFSEVNKHACQPFTANNESDLAQMEAADTAIEIAKDDGHRAIEIDTDSQYVVDTGQEFSSDSYTVSRNNDRVNKISKGENAKANELAHFGIGSTGLHCGIVITSLGSLSVWS